MSNRLSLCAIKRSIYEHLIRRLLENENSKEYPSAVGERFHVSDNAESGYLMK